MISSTNNLTVHSGNGVTVDFVYDFRIMSANDLRIFISGEPQVSGWSVNTSNSTVTFTSPVASGTDNLVIMRETSPTQGTQYPEGIKFPTQTVERDLDYRAIVEQDLYQMGLRSVRLHPSVLTGDEDLRLLANSNARAGRTIVFTNSGQGIEIGPTANEVADAQGYAENAYASMLAAQAAAEESETIAGIIQAKGDLPVGASAGTLDNLSVGTNGQVLAANSLATLGVSWETPGSFVQQWPAGYIHGFLIQNGVDTVNDLNIQPGEATSSDSDIEDRVLLSTYSIGAMTKRLDATWAEGHDGGMRSSSVSLTNTTYHIFIIRVGGVDDYGADTDNTGANLIADHSATHVRRIFSIQRISGTIRQFQHDRDHVYWKVPVADWNSTIANTGTLVQLSVPSGITPIAMCNLCCAGGTAKGVAVFHVNQTVAAVPSGLDSAPGAAIAATYTDVSDTLRAAGSIQIHTSGAGQIRLATIASSTVLVVTYGYIDYRGRLG